MITLPRRDVISHAKDTSFRAETKKRRPGKTYCAAGGPGAVNCAKKYTENNYVLFPKGRNFTAEVDLSSHKPIVTFPAGCVSFVRFSSYFGGFKT